MGRNIGLDFGTTYSIAAEPKDAVNGNYEPEAIELTQRGDEVRPTIALIDKWQNWHFGDEAKTMMGGDDVNPYEGFKLLLAEADEEELRKRGYGKLGEEDKPYNITKKYLENFLGDVKNRIGEDIDKIVVGVPEIWINEIETKKYEVLREIIENTGIAKDVVTTISEPQCACAYYVKKYEEKKKEKFQGRILLIDYGGGTLDIALCDINKIKKEKISVIARNGKGKNEYGEVGAAGLLYMEETVKLALKQQGIRDEDIEKNKAVFYQCCNHVENAFFSIESRNENNTRWTKFFEVFEEDSLESISEKYSDSNDPRHFFTEIKGYFEKDGEIRPVIATVTYGLVAQAYINVIQTPLDEALEEISKEIDELNNKYKSTNERVINYRGENVDDDFKIQVIGGFGKFYLVEKQIKGNEHIGRAANEDKRYEDGLETAVEKERAVAYGAALFANDIYEAGTTAPYSLGIWGSFHGTESAVWALNKRDDIEYNRKYLFKMRKEMMPSLEADAVVILHGSGIQLFAVERTYGKAEKIEPKNDYKPQLRIDDTEDYVMGISIDRSRRISLHKWAITDKEQFKTMRDNITDLEHRLNSKETVPGLEYKGSEKLSTIYDISTAPLVVSL